MAGQGLAGGRRAHGRLRRSPVLVPAAVAAVMVVTWIVTVERMRGMDAGPGTNLGSLGWFIGVWATMMAAMMLPSLMPITLSLATATATANGTATATATAAPQQQQRERRGASFVLTWVFIGGYLTAWTAYGLGAYALFRAVQSAHIHALSWHAQGPLIAGATIVAAGLYQLSPLKRRCLRVCRSPEHLVPGSGRAGWAGAVRTGFAHGVLCIGCCWGLMAILFALGVMSIVWMVVVGGLIFAEKVLPFGERLSRGFAVAFAVAGIWVAAAPSTVPGLTQPGSASAMRAMRAMGNHDMQRGTGMRKTPPMGTGTPVR